jgi:hypothetical protein
MAEVRVQCAGRPVVITGREAPTEYDVEPSCGWVGWSNSPSEATCPDCNGVVEVLRTAGAATPQPEAVAQTSAPPAPARRADGPTLAVPAHNIYPVVPIVAIDTETTGLDRRAREVWDVGLVRREPDGSEREWGAVVGEGLDLFGADPEALQVGRFYDRHPEHGGTNDLPVLPEELVACEVARRLEGAHLVGAVPSFEDTGLFRLLDRYNLIPEDGSTPWHYHLVDVEALAAGALGLQPPWDSGELSRALGVEPAQFERHSALGDARWALALYDAVMGDPVGAATQHHWKRAALRNLRRRYELERLALAYLDADGSHAAHQEAETALREALKDVRR